MPYAIDFMNPAPDADVHSVGEANFDWIVEAMAALAIRKALEPPGRTAHYRWDAPSIAGSRALRNVPDADVLPTFTLGIEENTRRSTRSRSISDRTSRWRSSRRASGR